MMECGIVSISTVTSLEAMPTGSADDAVFPRALGSSSSVAFHIAGPDDSQMVLPSTADLVILNATQQNPSGPIASGPVPGSTAVASSGVESLQTTVVDFNAFSAVLLDLSRRR